MRKRIFICAERKYPKIEAASNRMEYNAKALQSKGYQVIVIGIGDNFERDYCKEDNKYYYNGVEYRNMPIPQKSLDQRLKLGKYTCEQLKQYNLVTDDAVILYTSNAFYARSLINYAFKKVGANVSFDVVEWFQPFQFKFGVLNPSYLSYYYCFHHLYGYTKKVIGISEHISDYFRKKNANVLTLPILTDPIDYDFKGTTNEDGKLHLIYPGNPIKKDSLADMLKGIDILSDEDKEKVVFHTTGVKRKTLSTILGKDVCYLDKLCKSGNVIVHPWMEYTELTELFSQMNFLLIARTENEATLSNFPSKVPELLACGISTIAVRVGDYYHYLDDDINAILYDGCSPGSVKGAIERCLKLSSSELEIMRQNARKCAEEKFDYRIWAGKLKDFVEN